MKAEEAQQVITQTEASAWNAGGAVVDPVADVTTQPRTKAELEQTIGVMDTVCERGNLKLAYQRMVANKGAIGVDGIGVAEFKDHLKPSNTGRRSKASYWQGAISLYRHAGWISRNRKSG